MLLDNIRSLYNVGALFRTADGAGVTHLICSGITATPEHPKVAKTALGAEITSQWHYSRNGWQTAAALQEQGWQIWVIERTEKAEDLFAVQRESTLPIVLVTGNERAGVDPAILRLADKVISLPMQGSKGSLNVAVAFGIALYTLRFGQKERLT